MTEPMPAITLTKAFRLGPWRVLRDQNRLERQDGDQLHTERIEPKAMDVLCMLAENFGQTVTREALLEKVWAGRPVVENVLSRIILALRGSLGDDARSPAFIETVHKRGYRLLVQPVPEDAVPAISPAAQLPVAVDSVEALPASERMVARPARSWRWPLLTVAALLFVAAWFGWPRIRLELATSSGLDAMLFRGESAGDRAELRDELRQIRPGRVLWVDDQPAGNQREITTLERAGLVVDVVTSNAAAADQMRGREYDLLISDIRRRAPESGNAGLDLPRAVVPDRNRLPPLIYYLHKVTAPRTPDGYPVTDKPSELFRMVSDVFRWRQTSPDIQPLEQPVGGS
jgi:DNA-binding winged helix-turn-helix (wHTH) protein